MTGGVTVLKFIEATVANFDKLPDLLEQSIKKAREEKGDLDKDEFKDVWNIKYWKLYIFNKLS